MKIVEKAIKQTYRFSCPVCGSRLEGESQEFVDIGGKINKFFFFFLPGLQRGSLYSLVQP